MMEQFTEIIGTVITKRLPGFVFKKPECCVLRQSKVGWQAIAINVLPTASSGVGKLASHAKVRIDAIESIYTPHHPFLQPRDVRTHATITVNCDSLFSNKALAHGFDLDLASVGKFAEAYSIAAELELIPWLEKYSDEQALYEGLIDSNPKNWISTDRLTRFPVLMAILAKRQDIIAFDAIAAEFQEWCKQKHALVYAPLAKAMLKLRPSLAKE